MAEDDLHDLMNRLRFATGKATASVPLETAVSSIGENCRLVLQQSLCRHPALVFLHKSRDSLKEMTLKHVESSLQDETVHSDDAHQLLGWINEVAESLELERLGAVYSDASHILMDLKQKMIEELGVSSLPSFSQNNIGNISQWNLLFTLVVGPLLEIDENHYKPVELYLPNPTPGMIADLLEINKNRYRTVSWISLLNALGDLPIKSIRHIWLAAVFLFPTCGPLLVLYLRKEIDDIAKRHYLWEETDTDNAKDTYRSCCRVLNCFLRHLPLCFSVDLYRLFFKFLETFVRPDESTWERLFKTALQRDIGHCPTSTDIWRRYIKWKSERVPDSFQRREWIRKMYIRILRTPLYELQEMKEDYDFFMKTEYRGRPPLDNRLEERFSRARSATNEILKLMGILAGNPQGHLHGGDALPRFLYLPRPVKLCTKEYNGNDREEVMRRIEIDLWCTWMSFIDRERNSSAYVGIELFGYERVRFFLSMRVSFFPHQSFSWLNLVDYCLHHQSTLSEAERRLMARMAIERACFLLPRNLYVQLFYCDCMLYHLADAESAHQRLKELLMAQKQLVLDYVKKEPFSFLDGVLNALENIALLSINWMRWGSLSKEVTITHHIRLVARFTIHRVDFLSLILGTIKRASVEEKLFTPTRCQRALNTFCQYWIKMELLRSNANTEALLILRRWKDHLKMFLTSAKVKRWSLVESGVDESFTSSCIDVSRANPTTSEEVLEFLKELNVVASSGIFVPDDVEFLSTSIHHFRDEFLLTEKDTEPLSFPKVPSLLCRTRPSGKNIPLQTYDHFFFTSDQMCCDDETCLEDHFTTTSLTPTVLDCMPDDTRWRPFGVVRSGNETEYVRPTKEGTEIEARFKKNRRTLSKRSIVSEGVSKISDLKGAFERLGFTFNQGLSLDKLETMLMWHLPTLYESDILFTEKTIDTDWLLHFLEETPAINHAS